MKIKNKTIKQFIKVCRDVLVYCGDKLGQMYDEEDYSRVPQFDGMIYPMEPYEDVETVGTSDVIFEEKVNTQDLLCEDEQNIVVSDDDDLYSESHEKTCFRKLIQETADLIVKYDSLACQLTGDSKELLSDVSLKLIENLIRSGCTPIFNDKEYDMKRHRVIPYAIVNNGTPIKKTQRIGVEWNKEVFVLAIVEI